MGLEFFNAAYIACCFLQMFVLTMNRRLKQTVN